MNKKVLLINPPAVGNHLVTRNIDCAAESKGNYLLQSFDFILLSAVFSKRYQLHYLDAPAQQWKLNDLLGQAKLINPDIIIVAVVDTLWKNDQATLVKLRALYPHCLIWAFGDAFLEESNVQEICLFADGVIVSPLQIDACSLLYESRESFKQRGEVAGFWHPDFYHDQMSKQPIPQNIDVPRHELFQHDIYRWPFARHHRYATVSTNWGCPYRCSYCIDSRLPFIYRPYDNVIPELDYIDHLGVREIYFADKSFGVPKENCQLLLQQMIAKRYNFSWSTYLHPRQYSPDFFELIKRAGCHTVIIGIETANLPLLQKYDRTVNQSMITDLIKFGQQVGLEVCGDFLFGLEGETEEDINKTIDFSLSLGLDYASYNLLAPLPGTSVRQDAIRDNRLLPGQHHFDSLGRFNVLDSGTVSGPRLIALRNKAVRKFFYRPSYLWKRLRAVRSGTHLAIQAKEMLVMTRKLLLSNYGADNIN